MTQKQTSFPNPFFRVRTHREVSLLLAVVIHVCIGIVAWRIKTSSEKKPIEIPIDFVLVPPVPVAAPKNLPSSPKESNPQKEGGGKKPKTNAGRSSGKQSGSKSNHRTENTSSPTGSDWELPTQEEKNQTMPGVPLVHLPKGPGTLMAPLSLPFPLPGGNGGKGPLGASSQKEGSGGEGEGQFQLKQEGDERVAKTPNFIAKIKSDGGVEFQDKTGFTWDKENFTMSFDGNAALMKALGLRVHAAEKRKFLEQTKGLRKKLWQEEVERRSLRAYTLLLKKFQKLVEDATQSAAQKRFTLFGYWMECGDEAAPSLSAEIREMTERLIREKWPKGTEQGYTDDELFECNKILKDKNFKASFKPYQ